MNLRFENYSCGTLKNKITKNYQHVYFGPHFKTMHVEEYAFKFKW